MAEEVTIRIKVEEAGAATAAVQPRAQPSQPARPPVAGSPAKPFDPYAEAQKRHESELRASQVRAAYDDLYGEAESSLNGLIDVADQVGSAVGGVAGSIIKAGLDFVKVLQSRPTPNAATTVSFVQRTPVAATTPSPQTTVAGRPSAAVPPVPAVRATPKQAAVPVQTATKAAAPAAAAALAPEAAMAGGAATAGIVGAAIGAYVVAMNAAAEATRAFTSSVGKSAVSWVSTGTDLSASSQQFGSDMADVSSATILIMPAFALLRIGTGELVSSFGKLMSSVDSTAKRYEQFNPELAQASAVAEIAETLGDLRRAQESGPALARYVLAKVELQQKYEDIKVRLLTRVLPAVTGALGVLEKAAPFLEASADNIGEVLDALTAILRFVGLIEENTQPELDAQGIESPTEAFLRRMRVPVAPEV